MHFLKWGVAARFFSRWASIASFERGILGEPECESAGKDLFVWSFMMASAHGAGVDAFLPILMSQPMIGMTHNMTGGIHNSVCP